MTTANVPPTSPPTLRLDPSSPSSPLATIALANHISSSLPVAIQVDLVDDGSKPTLVLAPGGERIEGSAEVMRQLANMYAQTQARPCGNDQDESAQVNAYVTLAFQNLSPDTSSADFATMTNAANDLDDRLALRTFFVGNTPTGADFAIWGALRGNLKLRGILKKGQHPHFSRWFAHLESLPACADAVNALMAAKSNKERNKKVAAGFEMGLEGAVEGAVVTRFPPEPSGYLHIGHAKAAILNQYFAKAYKGKLIIRFDDTNPSKEKVEFQDSILEDLELLGIKPDVVSYTSNYFDELFRLVHDLIKKGKAYADDTDQATMRDQRMHGIPSKRRDASAEDNLVRFADMASGAESGRPFCLRAKISVDDPNKAMRDPVIYRCNDTPHHRIGTKYKVYPTYDFACPVVDSLEGVTHALRTNEYRDRNPQYYWMIEQLGLRKVNIWDFSRLNFVYTLLSKRKLQWFVDNGHVSGWADPRFPTVRGIRRRGMTIEAIQQFILATGPSQAILNMEWDAFWTVNKRILDPVVPRHVALDKKDLVKVNVRGAPELHVKVMPRHKKNPEIGNKSTVFGSETYVEQADAVTFEQDEEITLMDWGNAFVRAKHMSADGKTVESIDMDLHVEGDFKKTKKKVTWLSPSSEMPLADITLIDFDYLITKKKLEEDDKFEDFLTPQTEFRVEANADYNVLKQLKPGDAMQFERKGYYILDRVEEDANAVNGKKPIFFNIPDGKAASSASKAAGLDRGAQTKGKKEKKEQNGEGKGSKADGAGADVKTSMYRVAPHSGDVETPAKTSMYKVAPIS